MFIIERTRSGGFYWRLVAANGETLCHSEEYSTKGAALDGVAAVRRIAPIANVRDLT